MTPKNNDPFSIWNNPMEQDNPFAPHNGFDGDNPFKPWNQPFGREDDLTDRERRDYNMPPKRGRYDEDDY